MAKQPTTLEMSNMFSVLDISDAEKTRKSPKKKGRRSRKGKVPVAIVVEAGDATEGEDPMLLEPSAKAETGLESDLQTLFGHFQEELTDNPVLWIFLVAFVVLAYYFLAWLYDMVF